MSDSSHHNYLPMFTSAGGESRTLAAYGAALKSWSAPYCEMNIPTSFGETHVIASGQEGKPPLVLMHAMFATATVWYPNAGALSRGFRTYAVDIMGEANKSRPTRRITSLGDYTQWFDELLDGLGAQEFGLVGNSYGGFLSAHLAMSLPQRVRRLVLISPAATFHQIVPFYVHMFIPKALYLFFPKLPGQRRLMAHSIRWAYAGLPRDRVWTRLFYEVLLHGTTATQVFPRVFSKEELGRIEAPTLLLVGDREKIYRPEAVMRSAKQLLPTIKRAIVPGAHHIAAQAQPNIVSEYILKFCGPDPLRQDLIEAGKASAPTVDGLRKEPATSLVGIDSSSRCAEPTLRFSLSASQVSPDSADTHPGLH
jgi:pimeloyl-ACP methyl ester carboxylesterase